MMTSSCCITVSPTALTILISCMAIHHFTAFMLNTGDLSIKQSQMSGEQHRHERLKGSGKYAQSNVCRLALWHDSAARLAGSAPCGRTRCSFRINACVCRLRHKTVCFRLLRGKKGTDNGYSGTPAAKDSTCYQRATSMGKNMTTEKHVSYIH